jgi:hypothetical protein
MNINIASTHCNHHFLLIHKKEVLHASGTYHSSSTNVYQLSIAHLVDKHKYLYNKDDIWKGTTMQPITIIQDPTCCVECKINTSKDK